MSNDKPSWDYVLPLWWAFFWRATVFGFLAGAVAGFIGGFIVGVAGHPQAGSTVGSIMGYLVSIPVSIFVFRHILGKSYKSFSVQIVKNAS